MSKTRACIYLELILLLVFSACDFKVVNAIDPIAVAIGSSAQQVSIPTFTPAPGADGVRSSDTDFSVAILCSTSGAVIHYTTDGSTPTASTDTYKGPIDVKGDGTTLTIKAIATTQSSRRRCAQDT